MTLPRSGKIAWNRLFLPCLAEPPAESPSTKKSSLIVLSLPWAGVNLPDKITSFLLLFLPALASSRAFLAASLAFAAATAFVIIDTAESEFSSKKVLNFS